jgi:acetylornithine deacetylase/succinyl-diaminopimelate desuccinylase-like protein
MSDKWLIESHDAIIDFLVELVATPSDNPPGDCEAIAICIEERLRSLGLDTERHSVPRAANAPPAPVVLAWLGPQCDEPAVLLNAHMDVIPPGEGWSVDPYRTGVLDGRVLGRGAAVSKSDVAAFSYAMAAAQRRLPAPARSAVLAVTSDEETGGQVGPAWLLAERGLRPQMAITAGVTHQVGIAHNGCVQCRIRVDGKSSHAAMASNGTDAIRLGERVLSAIYAYGDTLASRHSALPGIDHATVAVTSFHAGDVNGVTAASAEIQIDRRVIPEEIVDDALDELRAVIDGVDAEAGSVVIEPTLVVPPLASTNDGQAALADVIRTSAEHVLGYPIPLRGAPIFTDARWFGNAGIATVMFGAGPADLAEARGHAADENVRTDDLIAATHIVANSIVELLA